MYELFAMIVLQAKYILFGGDILNFVKLKVMIPLSRDLDGDVFK